VRRAAYEARLRRLNLGLSNHSGLSAFMCSRRWSPKIQIPIKSWPCLYGSAGILPAFGPGGF